VVHPAFKLHLKMAPVLKKEARPSAGGDETAGDRQIQRPIVLSTIHPKRD
jgi:hypothetical protein